MDAVKKPTEGTGRRFAEGVAEQLVDDLMKIRVRARKAEANGAQADEPEADSIELSSLDRAQHPGDGERPDEVASTAEFVEQVQLQVVCQTLWAGLNPDVSLITAEHLRACGDADRALSAFYEDCVRVAVLAVPALGEKDVRGWFEGELITEGGTRGTVFRGRTKTGRLTNEAVEVLVGTHIVRGENRGGGRWYELAHDRFIKPIRESNRRWRSGDSGRTQRELERAANAWAKAPKSSKPRLLLSGEALIRAETWIDSPDADELGYSDQLANFLRESRAAVNLAEERAKTREARRRVWGLSAVAISTLGLAVLTTSLWRNAASNAKRAT